MADPVNPGSGRLMRTFEADMYDLVEQAHAGTPHRIWSTVKGGVKQKLNYSSERRAIGVKVGAAVAGSAVVIVTGIATGGVSLGVLAGVCAGAYAMRKLVSAVGTAVICRRRNRNWLAQYQGAANADEKAWARALADDSSDAIRRLIDRFRRCVDAKEKYQEAWRANPGPQNSTCAEYREMARLFARFHYELNKTRNYLLPCLETILFVLNQQITLAHQWNTFHGEFAARVTDFLTRHGDCGDPCYAAQGMNSSLPKRRLEGMAGMAGRNGRTIGHYDTREITDLIRALMISDVEIEKSLKRQDTDIMSVALAVDKARNALRMSRWGAGIAAPKRNPTIGLRKLMDDAFRDLSTSNPFKKMARSAKGKYRRTTSGEKVMGAISEFLDLGTSFVPMAGPALRAEFPTELVRVFGKSLTMGNLATSGIGAGTTGTVFLGTLVSGKLVHATEAAAGREGIRELENANLKEVGLRSSDTFRKMAEHGIEANEALAEIDKGVGASVGTCREVIAVAKPVYEFLHHFDKMYLYACENMAALSFIHSAVVNMTAWETTAANNILTQGAYRVCGDHTGCGRTCYGK